MGVTRRFPAIVGITFLIFQTINSVETLFSPHSVILYGSNEGNPLSPPKGEAAQREHPLDPLFFTEYYFQPSQGLSHYGGCPSGAGVEARCKKEPPRAIDCFSVGFNKVRL
jgi:hypothetical protein